MTQRIGILRRCTHAVDRMNIDYLIKRLIGRATCRLERGAVLSHCARIKNAAGDTDKIVVGGTAASWASF